MNDTIYRQAVKEWLAKWEGYIDADTIARMQYRVIDIPSARPEIVRCEECKHANEWHKGKKAWCDGWDNVVFKGDFCSYAERRTDESDL